MPLLVDGDIAGVVDKLGKRYRILLIGLLDALVAVDDLVILVQLPRREHREGQDGKGDE